MRPVSCQTGKYCEGSTSPSTPGAKIGVIGTYGSGKSSLLKIMAGVDDGFTGEARLTPGFTVGYLAQEPELDPSWLRMHWHQVSRLGLLLVSGWTPPS